MRRQWTVGAAREAARCLSIGYQWKHPTTGCSHSHRHTTKSPYGCNKHQESARAPVCLCTAFPVFQKHALTYLISSTFSATSMHIDERKRSHHESRCVAYKNHDRLYCDKGEERKAAKWRAGFPPPEVFNQRWKERIEVKTLERPMCTQTPREMPSGAARATRFSCLRLFPTDELCSSKRSAGRINRIHNVRALPPPSPPPPPPLFPLQRTDSHRGHLVFGPQRRCRDENELQPRMESSARAAVKN